MNPLQQLWEAIRRAFGEAGVNVGEQPSASAPDHAPPVNRVIAASQLFGKVYNALRELNLGARSIGEDGYVYTDWDKYLSPMDIYYDDDGTLFLLCARAGKIYRMPITVEGENVSLGEPVEIPLTGRAVQSRFTVVRDANAQLRWYAIAATSVLNRVGEIDSRELFDSFIAHALETGEYPILSFYHLPEQIRFGIADTLARDENLYIASGTFDDNDVARAAAAGLSADNAAEWGTSIGFYVTSEPTLLRVGEVNIPVYTRGVNSEISIVLEREAAAHFTSIGTREVNRIMEKSLYERLVALVGKDRADALAAQADETNRAIVDAGMVTRADDGLGGTQPTQTTDDGASNAPQSAQVAAAEMQSPAQNETMPQTREVVLDDETLNALVGAFAQSEAFVNWAQQVAQIQTQVGEIVSQLNTNTEALQTVNASIALREAALDQRVRALERTEAEKRREWQADLPAPQQVIVTHRPRDARAVETDANGQPNAQTVADATLANMKTRQPLHGAR